ncbi:MAG: hypothetical protein ABSB12_01930 [Candidatus Saccharimonadales bacterium]|jgi:hypothetical protein
MEKRIPKIENPPIDSRLQQFLNPDYSYRFSQNPDVVRTKEDAIRNGINCISLAHLVIKELFNYELPSGLLCAELFLDQEHFAPITDISNLQMGDLVWFGNGNNLAEPSQVELRYGKHGKLINWREFPVKHVAIYTGVMEVDDPLLLHATFFDGGKNTIWPMSKFQTYQRYKKMHGVTRFIINC